MYLCAFRPPRIKKIEQIIRVAAGATVTLRRCPCEHEEAAKEWCNQRSSFSFRIFRRFISSDRKCQVSSFSSLITTMAIENPTTAPSPPKAAQKSLHAASDIVELISSRSTTASAVFIYDLALQAGFGSLTESWSHSDGQTAPVVSLQTRAGAGLSLVGRLSQVGS